MVRISAHELHQWYVFEQIYGPLNGGERIDHAAAFLAQTYINTNRGKGKAPARLEYFLPKWSQREVIEDGDNSEPDATDWP